MMMHIEACISALMHFSDDGTWQILGPFHFLDHQLSIPVADCPAENSIRPNKLDQPLGLSCLVGNYWRE